jgi:hypothetical protein
MTAKKKIPPELWHRFEKARDDFEAASSAHRAALDRVSEAARRQITEGTTYADQEMIAAKKAAVKTGDRLTAALEKERFAAHDFRAAHKANPRSSRKLDNALHREREARAEVERFERDRDLSLAKIGELSRRFMDGEAGAGQLLREASAEFSATSSRLTDALERRRRAEFEYKMIVAPGQINPCGSAPNPDGLDDAKRKVLETYVHAYGDLLFSPSEDHKAQYEAAKAALDASGYGSTWGKSSPIVQEMYREIFPPTPRAKKTKRKRSARANPALVEGELWAPPGFKPPRTLALLAELVEMVVKSPDGTERTIRPKPNTAAMLTDRTGEVLWFVWPTKTKRAALPRGARGEKRIFETWSKHRASVSLKLSTAEKFPATPIGVLRVVRYRSDKWTGEPTLYEHEFTSKNVKAYADNARTPKIILASVPSHDPRQAAILVSSRGLVN